jgi:hypothetical protein
MDVKNQLNPLTSSQKYQYSSFNIFHQNIRGLKDKHDKMICSLISFNINPQLICISEHYTIEHNLSTISLENYKLAVNFSHVNYQGGGTCIFIRNNLTYSPLTVSQSGEEKILAPCALQVSIGETDIVVLCT